MRRTSGYIISLLLIFFAGKGYLSAQDTLSIPLKIKAGLEVSGPVTYFIEKNNIKIEGYISMDLNERRSLVLGAGYLNYEHSQYNYNYLNKGMFMRAGVDFNLLKPEKSMGRYWAGIGLRYGLSRFTSEIPSFTQENYWGPVTSSIAPSVNWGHFLEVTPGIRAEIFSNVSVGWSISLRMLLYSGTGKELRPVYFPGFGNGVKTISTGLSYFITFNIPYKRIRVITQKEEPEEDEESDDTENGQQNSGIR
jgi:hypothetical protein